VEEGKQDVSHPDRKSDHERIEKEQAPRKEEAEKERPKGDKPRYNGYYSFDRLREQVMAKVPPEEATIALRNLQALTHGYILALDDVKTDMDLIYKSLARTTLEGARAWSSLEYMIKESRASAVDTVRILEEQVQQRTAEILGGAV
jgi:hypothetical protein